MLKLDQPGKQAEAIDSLRRTLQLDPRNLRAKRTLAELDLTAYLALPNRPPRLYEEATKLISELLAADPKDFHGLRLRGTLALADRNPAEATSYFRQAHAVSPPGNYDATLGLARSLFENGEFSEGERLARGIIERKQTFEPPYDLLYVAYLQSNQRAKAEAILHEKVRGTNKVAAYVELARHLRRSGNLATSEAAILSIPSGSPDADLYIGDFYVSVQEWDKAYRRFEAGAENDKKQRPIYLKRALGASLRGKPSADALILANRIFGELPNDSEVRTIRAALMAQSGQQENLRTAVAEFTKLSVEQPGDATNQYNLGTALQRLGQLEEARAAFRNAISKRPDYTAPRALLAEIGLYQQNPQETIRYAREILALQPDLDRAKLLLAMGLMHAGQFAEARFALRSVNQPDSYDAKLQLGMIRLAEGDYKGAHAVFQQIYRPGSNDLAPVIGITSTYVKQKQFDRALSFLQDALPASANPSGIRYLIAATALASKRYEVAAREYESLFAAQPASIGLLVSLAEARYLAGDRAAAINALSRAKALSPRDSNVLARIAYAYEQAGDTQQAIAAYRGVLVMEPNRIDVLNNLALLLAESESNHEEAEALARRVVEQSKNRPEMRDTLAWVRFRAAGWQTTLPVFADLATTYPDNAVYRYHLGAALLQKGDREKAREELQAALNAHPDSLTAANVRRLLQSPGR